MRSIMVRHRRSLPVILALGVLLVTPLAWGCEATDVQSCSTSDCPMAALPGMEDCQAPSSSTGHDSPGCSAEPDAAIECCAGSGDREPVRLESTTSLQDGSSPLSMLAERVEARPPSRPPDSIPEDLASRRHGLGRFTLHASLLL